MNWKKLKERFPKSHDEIKSYAKEHPEMSSDILMRNFLFDKGYEVWGTWINALKDYESNKCNS